MPLKEIPTVCREDSDGEVWGIQGRLLWLMIGGAVLSLLILTAAFVVFQIPILGSLVLCLPPLFLAIAYTILKQTKPPGYDHDLMNTWTDGRAFGPPWK